MTKKTPFEPPSKKTGYKDADLLLPEVSDNGSYWVVKAPEHGIVQLNVIGFDEDFNYQHSEDGNIYCANCMRYYFHKKANSVKSCKTCHAPFSAGNWFNNHTYTVEINGNPIKRNLSYEKAIEIASNRRNPKDAVYVFFEKKED